MTRVWTEWNVNDIKSLSEKLLSGGTRQTEWSHPLFLCQPTFLVLLFHLNMLLLLILEPMPLCCAGKIGFIPLTSPLIIITPSTLRTICLPRHVLNLLFFILHYSLIRLEHVRLRNTDLPPDGMSLRSGFEEWMCKQYTWKFSSWFYQFLIDIPGVWQNARRLQRWLSEALLSTSIAELAATKGQWGKFRSC